MFARAAGRSRWLALILLILATGVNAFGPLTPGRKWIKLMVPRACRASSGWLGPAVCGSPSGNALLLKTVAGGPWAMWRLTAAPGKATGPGQDPSAGVPVVLRIEGRTTPLPKCGSKLGAPACPSYLGTFPACAYTAMSMAPTNGSLRHSPVSAGARGLGCGLVLHPRERTRRRLPKALPWGICRGHPARLHQSRAGPVHQG